MIFCPHCALPIGGPGEFMCENASHVDDTAEDAAEILADLLPRLMRAG